MNKKKLALIFLFIGGVALFLGIVFLYTRKSSFDDSSLAFKDELSGNSKITFHLVDEYAKKDPSSELMVIDPVTKELTFSSVSLTDFRTFYYTFEMVKQEPVFCLNIDSERDTELLCYFYTYKKGTLDLYYGTKDGGKRLVYQYLKQE